MDQTLTLLPWLQDTPQNRAFSAAVFKNIRGGSHLDTAMQQATQSTGIPTPPMPSDPTGKYQYQVLYNMATGGSHQDTAVQQATQQMQQQYGANWQPPADALQGLPASTPGHDSGNAIFNAVNNYAVDPTVRVGSGGMLGTSDNNGAPIVASTTGRGSMQVGGNTLNNVASNPYFQTDATIASLALGLPNLGPLAKTGAQEAAGGPQTQTGGNSMEGIGTPLSTDAQGNTTYQLADGSTLVVGQNGQPVATPGTAYTGDPSQLSALEKAIPGIAAIWGTAAANGNLGNIESNMNAATASAQAANNAALQGIVGKGGLIQNNLNNAKATAAGNLTNVANSNAANLENARTLNQPYIGAGESALGRLSNLNAPELTKNPALNINTSNPSTLPGYSDALQQGVTATLNSMPGQHLGGATGRALGQYVTGLTNQYIPTYANLATNTYNANVAANNANNQTALQSYLQQVDQLRGIAGMGQTAAGQVQAAGNLGTQLYANAGTAGMGDVIQAGNVGTQAGTQATLGTNLLNSGLTMGNAATQGTLQNQIGNNNTGLINQVPGIYNTLSPLVGPAVNGIKDWWNSTPTPTLSTQPAYTGGYDPTAPYNTGTFDTGGAPMDVGQQAGGINWTDPMFAG